MPRTWWKTLLHAHDLIDPDYPACTDGLDHWWLDGFGIKDEEMLEYVTSEKPNYLTFEKWVSETARRKPNPVGRDSWNTLIETRIHRPSKFYSITKDLGMEPAIDLKSAVVLNHLEDWHYFYERDFPGTQSQTGPVIPLISTMDYGRLGVCQLPRTWLKVLLEAKGKLHPDYPACGDGLDAKVLKLLNLDRDRTVSYLKSELPSYNEFETWILSQPEVSRNRDDIQEWNNYLRNLEHVNKRREFIFQYMGLTDDGTITSAMVLNTIEDCEYAYRALTANR